MSSFWRDRDLTSTETTMWRVSRSNSGITICVASQIDQWVDYVSTTIAPVSNLIQRHIFGEDESDPKTFGLLVAQLKSTLTVFEKQLKLKNFLVGYVSIVPSFNSTLGNDLGRCGLSFRSPDSLLDRAGRFLPQGRSPQPEQIRAHHPYLSHFRASVRQNPTGQEGPQP